MRPGRSCDLSAGPMGRPVTAASNAGARRPTAGASATPAHTASARRSALCARLASEITHRGAGRITCPNSCGSTMAVMTITPRMPATQRTRPKRSLGTAVGSGIVIGVLSGPTDLRFSRAARTGNGSHSGRGRRGVRRLQARVSPRPSCAWSRRAGPPLPPKHDSRRRYQRRTSTEDAAKTTA